MRLGHASGVRARETQLGPCIIIISDGYPVIKRSSDRTLKMSGGPFTIWYEYIVPRENKVVKERK